jgi:hypothetical protein
MKTELKYAVIFIVASFLWNCLEFAAGLQGKYINIHPYFVTSFFIILTASVYYFAIREKRAGLYGRITFAKAFITGLVLTIFILILNPFALYVFSTFVNTDFYNAFIQHDIMTGKYSPQEAYNYYNIKNFIIQGSLYRFIMGLLASIIISFILKKTH